MKFRHSSTAQWRKNDRLNRVMPANVVAVGRLVAIGLALAPQAAASSPSGNRRHCSISVGRNVQVSHARAAFNGYIIEPVIAVSPSDSNHLIAGGVISVGSVVDHLSFEQARANPQAAVELLGAVAFSSIDGGRIWRPMAWSKERNYQLLRGQMDVGAIFNQRGEAIFSTYGASHNTLSWSTKPFLTWGNSVGTPFERGVEPFAPLDRPMLTAGRGKRDFYITGLGARSEGASNYIYHLRFVVMDKHSAISDVTAVDADEVNWIQDSVGAKRFLHFGEHILVHRHGEISLNFISSVIGANGAGDGIEYWFTKSDGPGKSFEKPWLMVRVSQRPLISPLSNPSPAFAIDTSGKAYSDRIYVTWIEPVGERRDSPEWQLRFSWSENGGKMWQEPKTIEILQNAQSILAATQPYAGFKPTLPLIAVNNSGDILLSWYRISVVAGALSHQRMVSASFDGGKTFSQPRPLASQRTDNYRYRENGDLGHYMKLVSDRRGTFHAAWLDGRTGSQEIWYATVRTGCR